MAMSGGFISRVTDRSQAEQPGKQLCQDELGKQTPVDAFAYINQCADRHLLVSHTDIGKRRRMWDETNTNGTCRLHWLIHGLG